MPDLVVLSPCFYRDASCADLMLKSAVAHELNVRLYGVGQPFVPHGADAQVAKLYDLMQNKLADLVLVTDCRDVLFLAEPEEIIQKFEASGKHLVMSAEQGCWPAEQEIVDFYYGKDPNGYNYVNAGQYIGTWEYVQFCLKHLLDEYRAKRHAGADNSQGWWMWAKMRGELDFALDTECQIFQSMSGGADHQVVVENGRVLNTMTGSSPCSIHFNGNPGVFNPHADLYRRLYESCADLT